MTAERIGEIWLSVQGESLGPAIDIRPGYENFWMYIPHFIHSPFYVYAYAFGDCLVNSLYAVYENASDGFAERYLAMLAAGGTKHYSELLKPFGLDAKDPEILGRRAVGDLGHDRRAGRRWADGAPAATKRICDGRRTQFRPPSPSMMTVTTGGECPMIDTPTRRVVLGAGSLRGRFAAHDRWQRGAGPACRRRPHATTATK